MVKIIAEAGVNHNGSKELAFKLVDAAHAAGADIVKFQTFKAESLVTDTAKQAEYQARNTGVSESQLAMLKRLELDYETHKELMVYCKSLKIEFLSTAFDSDSLKFLVSELGLQSLKVPSGELTNAPFILEHALTGCDIILSTGMATLGEVEFALGVLAFGFIQKKNVQPSKEAFFAAYASAEGQTALKKKVTLLHCTTEYPAPMADINLKAMSTLKSAFNLKTGYSDHSEGITIPIAATALGACLIEKHFTLDKTLPGPDHKASLEPEELATMVKAIRDVKLALGTGVKGPQPSEIKNKPIARRSLVAAQSIKKGEVFSIENVTAKRPGTGMCPSNYWSLLGTAAIQDYQTGELIHV